MLPKLCAPGYSSLTQIRTDNLTELLEKATKSTETHVLTLKHMQDFVVGDEEEIPSPILEILKQRESFILDFVARYPTWFAQDLGQIMEQELEDVLDQFRGIGVEVEPATKIVALVNIRDLLIAIHTCIIEKEGLKESFSIDSILKLVNRPEIKFMGEIELTNLKTSLESIQNTNHLVEITYPNYANILPSLEGYIWRVEVKVILSRLRTKPDQIYKLFRSVPGMMKYQEEMKIITKRLKQVPMENIAEIKESINKFLNLNLQLVDARRFLDKALLGNIQDETVFGLVRLCNRITLNEMKLDEQMCQSLIDFGYPNCKLVMKHLGKETAMKKIDNEGVSSVMKSIEDGGTQIHASKEESQKDDSHMMSEHVGDTDTNSDLKNQSQEDSKDGNSLSPNKNSNNDEEMIEEQVEEQDDEQEEDKKESQKMDIEQVPVEETHEQTDEDYDENRMILEKIAEEEEIDQQAIGIDHLHQEGEASSKPLASINNQPEILEQEEHIVEDIEVQDYNESNKSNKDMEEEQLAQVEEELKDPERPSTPEEPMVVAEQMREQHLHHDESVDSTINLPLTFENGLSLLQRGIKPSNFEGTQSEFNEAVISAHKIYNKLQNEKLELHEYNNFLTKLSRSRFLIPDMDALRSKETVAITFRSTVLMLDPEHLVERKESLAIEHESLGIEVVEFKRILEEVERDFQTSVDVKNAIEDRENLTLHQITHIKNRDQAARYFKNKTLTLKLYDIFIMAIIAAWKSHDHEKGEPEIDYLSLQEAYGVCSFTDNGKERYIKPENAEFIKKLYEKVRCHLKKTFYVLSLEDLQTKNPEKSFKRFVDLTGKFIEYRFKLQEIQGRACPKNEEEPGKKRQLKPSGKKSLIHRKIDYQHQHQQEYTLSKPAFIDKITNEHRRYYVNSWKHYILNNKFLTDRKELAYSIANKLEKEVYAFYLKRSAIQYENVGNSILHFFSKLVNLKYMTLKLKSKDFSFEFIRRFKNFTAVELTKHDEGYKQATELEALQKTKPTGKQEKNATNEELTQQATKLNTEKTNEEAKDMKAGRNKKSGSNTNKIPINEDLEPKVSSLIKNNFQEFKIFEGRLKVAVKTGVRPFPLVLSIYH